MKEEESRGEVEFFEADIESEYGSLSDFFAMNVMHRVACTDMAQSEAELTDFDPARPSYDFDYQVLLPEFGTDLHIATCHEMPLLTVIDDVVLARLSEAKLKGLVLYSALDMTTFGRSVCIKL